jgi:predicted RNA-binding Zn-ribbon protein involved in translation (DUF1610 family)
MIWRKRKMFKCPRCGDSLKRFYSLDEVREMYKAKDYFDTVNLKMQTDMNRFRKCPNCDYVKYLSLWDLIKALIKSMFRVECINGKKER